MRTKLQIDADAKAARLRGTLADDLRRLREDAGLTRTLVSRAAGVDASTITKLEGGTLNPTIEIYMRVAAALGADFVARPYPNTGPPIHDRHQVRILELLLANLHPRWHAAPEVAVRRPGRGWVDVVLHDGRERTLVATELESDIRRVEQLLRWSREKAESLPSATEWPQWSAAGAPHIERLLVVRWTRANRETAKAARRVLREAYPADPRDALDALAAEAAWPGPAMLWAQVDGRRAALRAG